MLRKRSPAGLKTPFAENNFYGVSHSQDLHPEVQFYEIPVASLSSPAGACSASGSFWYISGEDEVDRRERQSLLLESCERLQAKACVINIPPAFSLRENLHARIFELAVLFKNKGQCPIYFDFGKQGPPQTLITSDLIQCVSDPLWHPGQVWSDYWKVHGWHAERWIRSYSDAELKKLVNLARKYKPRFLILAHSQRMEQWPIIAGRLSAQSNTGSFK